MEDNLKILKVEYLSNHLFDPTQILNLSLDGQPVLKFFFKWRRPPMEDELKILKVEYILLDHINIVNWSLYDQTIFSQSFKWR